MSQDIRIAVVYHSGFGHTEVLAHAVVEGAKKEGVSVSLLSVAENNDSIWDTLKEAHAVVFGSPTYMGSVSAPFKTFMDESSKVWFQAGWKDKLAAGFTNSASFNGDKLGTLSALSLFAAQHGMLWIPLGLPPGNNSSKGRPEDLNRLGASLGAMAQSNADQGPEIVPPSSDKSTASALGQRVAQAAKRWGAAQYGES